MISLKKLIAMARKWQKKAGINGRRKISFPGIGHSYKVADKGHFVVYSTDRKRFVVPLAYLGNKIFKELFRMSEEEFGLPGNGPITLPCDADFMEYVVSMIQRPAVSIDLEKALLVSMASSSQCLPPASVFEAFSSSHQITIHGF